MTTVVINTLAEYIEYIAKFRSDKYITILDAQLICRFYTKTIADFCLHYKVGRPMLELLQGNILAELKTKLLWETVKQLDSTEMIIISKNMPAEYRIKKTTLVPILNLQDNQLLGIEIESKFIDYLPNISEIFEEPQNVEYRQLPKLSVREHEILFLKLMGKTDIEISEILYYLQEKNVSAKTINSILRQQIYPKLDVYNKTGMLEKARQLGFNKLVPSSLMVQDQLILL